MQAALQEDAEAQFRVAEYYELGRGRPPKRHKALKWYKAAALQGDPRAEQKLSQLTIA